jgi:hypothetical protein
MSSQQPPIPFPLNPIFNIQDWRYLDTTALTYSEAVALFLLKGGDTATGLINFNVGLTSTSGAFSGLLTSSYALASNDNSTKVATTQWVNSLVSSNGTLSGTIISYAGNSVPSGYLLCNGQLVSRTTYATLFASIGTIYGSGDGVNTFAVPNLISKYIQGNSTSTNTSVGANSVSLTTGNLPQTTATLTQVGTNIPIVFNSPNGIGEWSYLKGLPSGDGSANLYNPRTTSSTANGTNLLNAFTASFGSATPTAVSTTPSSVQMMVLIKT